MTKDKIAIVTGGNRGIGKSVALALAEKGAKIVLVDVTPEGAEETLAAIREKGSDGIALQGNVTVAADVEAVVEKAVETYGKIDILVNNAGITRDGLLLRMKDEDWDAVLAVNLKGAFLFTRAVAKVMTKARYGRIVNIASVVGQMGNTGQANYCASKAGLIGLTKSNARELARRNVTVNAVAPGFIATAMTDALPEKAKQELSAQIPLERLGSAEDVAHAVAFLADDDSGYITGQVVAVNGGMYM